MSVTLYPSQCLSCGRFTSPLDGAPERTCTAFPGGIPPVVWGNKADHRRPFAGDNGLMWTPAADDVEFPEWALVEVRDAEA